MKNKLSAVGAEKLKNMFENIEKVYQLCSFRCIINLPYEVTPLLIFWTNLLYTESVRYLLFQKSCKVVNG